MSRLSFQILCIEKYAGYVGAGGSEIYKKFKDEGLLALLSSDYEDLHGMGTEYMIQFCKDYLGEEE